MWILPDDNIIREARSGCYFVFGGRKHPEINLGLWSREKLAALGIRYFQEVGLPVDGSQRITGYSDAYDEATNTLTRTYTTEEVAPTTEETAAREAADATRNLQEQTAYLFEMVLFLWQCIKDKTDLTNADAPAELREKAQAWAQYLGKIKAGGSVGPNPGPGPGGQGGQG